MLILDLLGFKKKCKHEKMSYNTQSGYCPECGEYVETRWYLVRCSCCGIKRIATTRGQEIIPKNSFCPNCGEIEYYIEELEKVNFIDINYASSLRITPKPVKENFSQSWIYETPAPKLLCSTY